MKRNILKIMAAILVAALLLSGCAGFGNWLQGVADRLNTGIVVPFSDMEYTRPDLTAFRVRLEKCCTMSQTTTDVEGLMIEVWQFFTLYHEIYTNYMLANIHYCKDMTDIYWSGEYSYCLGIISEVDAGMDQLLYTLAACPLKAQLETEDYFGAGYFDGYQGESVWNEEFTALAQQEAALLEQYYDLSSQAAGEMNYTPAFFDKYAQPLCQIYVELVKVRQQMAKAAGYEDFASFAYECYYYRDYTPAQTENYLKQIQLQLVPLYGRMPESLWDAENTACSQQQTYDYVKELAENAGGTVKEAFDVMAAGELYDIAPGKNKYNASFEMYLSAYYEPYIFMNPTLTAYDQLTFAHEFGHFCNDYASGGSIVGVDVTEVFSQSMEYMSLLYVEQGKALTTMKLADSLRVYVEQSAYASFEQQVYALEGEALTTENVFALYARVGAACGFDLPGWDKRDFVTVPHFFTNPLYIISYVVSNDAAMQIYAKELSEKGAGLALLEENFTTEEVSFLAFAESAGLESPFAPGRVEAVRDLFADQLQLRTLLAA